MTIKLAHFSPRVPQKSDARTYHHRHSRELGVNREPRPSRLWLCFRSAASGRSFSCGFICTRAHRQIRVIRQRPTRVRVVRYGYTSTEGRISTHVPSRRVSARRGFNFKEQDDQSARSVENEWLLTHREDRPSYSSAVGIAIMPSLRRGVAPLSPTRRAPCTSSRKPSCMRHSTSVGLGFGADWCRARLRARLLRASSLRGLGTDAPMLQQDGTVVSTRSEGFVISSLVSCCLVSCCGGCCC